MPYRHAHWYVLGLFPLAALAFWPTYLSKFATAEPAFHAHGLSATMWMMLLALQSWTIHHGRSDMHRRMGLASLLLFPLFLAGGASIFIGMAHRFVEATTPFYQLYPARLAWLDVVGVGGIAYFFYQAMRLRRKVWMHSGYLLATVIFLVPPIIGRLSPLLPGLSINGPADFAKLEIGFQLANGITAFIALVIGLRSRHGRPFFEASALVLLSALLFQTVGTWPSWVALFARFAEVPVLPFAGAAAVAGAAVGWAGWNAGKRSPRGGAVLA